MSSIHIVEHDAPVPVQVLSEFVGDNFANIDSNQIQLIQNTLGKTFNSDFRGLNFKELEEALAIYKKEKRLVFPKRQHTADVEIDQQTAGPTWSSDDNSESDDEGMKNSDPESGGGSSRRSSMGRKNPDGGAGATGAADGSGRGHHPDSSKGSRRPAWSAISEAQRTLHVEMAAEAAGLGSIIDTETTAKYFGEQGKTRFFNRYHWLTEKINKRNIDGCGNCISNLESMSVATTSGDGTSACGEASVSHGLWHFDDDDAAREGEIDDRLGLLNEQNLVHASGVSSRTGNSVSAGSHRSSKSSGSGCELENDIVGFDSGTAVRGGVICCDDAAADMMEGDHPFSSSGISNRNDIFNRSTNRSPNQRQPKNGHSLVHTTHTTPPIPSPLSMVEATVRSVSTATPPRNGRHSKKPSPRKGFKPIYSNTAATASGDDGEMINKGEKENETGVSVKVGHKRTASPLSPGVAFINTNAASLSGGSGVGDGDSDGDDGYATTLNSPPSSEQGANESDRADPASNMEFGSPAGYRPLTARTAYLEGCIREHVVPRAVIIRKHMTNCLKLQHQGLGDNKALIVAESLVTLPHLRSVNFASNSLGDMGVCRVVQALQSFSGLLELDLSHNTLGHASAAAIAAYLAGTDGQSCTLVRLVLSHTSLSDSAANAIIQGMLVSTNRPSGCSIRDLDLSHNRIGYNESTTASITTAVVHVVGDVVTGSSKLPSVAHGNNHLHHSALISAAGLATTNPMANHQPCSVSLGEWLQHPNCPLEALTLGWNIIRGLSAMPIMHALSSNRSLRYLDLAYNNIGSVSGITFGNSLLNNTTLSQINLGNNDIDASAVITICQGVIENPAVTSVFLDGNPIGIQGAKAVMSVPLCVGYRVCVSTRDCNIGIQPSPQCWFDYSNICRPYALKMEDPFDRAIAFALLRIVANHDMYTVCRASYSPDVPRGFIGMMPEPGAVAGKRTTGGAAGGTTGGAGGGSMAGKGGNYEEVVFVQSATVVDRSLLNDTQRLIIQKLEEIIHASSDPLAAKKLFEETDTDGGGTLDSDELRELLHDLGMQDLTDEQVDAIIQHYDIEGQQALGMEEFLRFLKEQAERAAVRLNDMTCIPFLALSSSPSVKYVPPRTGVLHIDIAPGGTRKKNIPAMSAGDRISLFEAALESVDHVKMISFAIQGTRLRLEEAQNIYHKLLIDIPHKDQVIGMILPYIYDSSDCKQFVNYCVGGDYYEWLKLRATMGNVLRPAFGTPDGYYCLNLKNELDRACLSKLLDLNATVSRQRMVGNPTEGIPSQSMKLLHQDGLIGDTSQKGNWSCFRNEFYCDQAIEVNSDVFIPMPTRGQLEFDFVSGMRPPWNEDENVKPTEDAKFLRVLGSCCIVKTNQHAQLLAEMKTIKDTCREITKVPTGSEAYHARTIHQSDQVFTAMERFYNSLSQRFNNIALGGIAAEIKFDYLDVMSSITQMAGTSTTAAGVGGGGGGINKSGRGTIAMKGGGNNRISSITLDSGYEATDSEEEEEEKKKRASKTVRVSRGTIRGSAGVGGAVGTAAGRLSMAGSTGSGGAGRLSIAAGTRKENTSTEKSALTPAPAAVTVVGYAQGQTPANSEAIVRDMTKETAPKYCFEENDTDVYTPKKSSAARSGVGAARRGMVMLAPPPPTSGSPGTLTKKGSFKKPLSGMEQLARGSRRRSSMSEVFVKAMVKRIAYKKMLIHPAVSEHAKAARAQDQLEEALSRIWITSAQLAMVMRCWQQGSVWRSQWFGTYRVELVISMLHRILDLHNFDVVLHYLTTDEIACLYCRIGWLNLYNPMKPEGCYKLNIKNYEDRQLLKLVITLTDVEPGVNFKYGQYYRNIEAGPLPGWDLPASWLVEKGVPTEGWVGFQYYAGEGKRLQGCQVCDKFRRSLLQMVWIDEREIDRDTRNFEKEENEQAQAQGQGQGQGQGQEVGQVQAQSQSQTQIESPSQQLTVGEETLMNDRAGEGIADLWLDYLCISPSYSYCRKIIQS